jgi:hypothetical protein
MTGLGSQQNTVFLCVCFPIYSTRRTAGLTGMNIFMALETFCQTALQKENPKEEGQLQHLVTGVGRIKWYKLESWHYLQRWAYVPRDWQSAQIFICSVGYWKECKGAVKVNCTHGCIHFL